MFVVPTLFAPPSQLPRLLDDSELHTLGHHVLSHLCLLYLLCFCLQEEYPAGHVVVQEGDTFADRFYIVEEVLWVGSRAVLRTSGKG